MASDRQGQSDGDGDDDGWQLSDVNGDFIELGSLFEFISIASTDEFIKKCKNIDSIFQSRLGLIFEFPYSIDYMIWSISYGPFHSMGRLS